MNHLYNNLKIGTFGVSLMAFGLMIASPLATSALNNGMDKSNMSHTTVSKSSTFCTSLPNKISSINSSLSSMSSKIVNTRGAHDQKTLADKTKWEQKVTTNRNNWDQQRQNNFTKLESKSINVTETTAIKTYEATITNAVNVRRAANDQARSVYRVAVENIVLSQRSTMDSQLATFSASVTSAESSAQASCQASPDQGATIRTTLQASLKNARLMYSADRKNDTSLVSQIRQLAQTRDASFKTNNSIFTATANTAQATLKAVLKNKKI